MDSGDSRGILLMAYGSPESNEEVMEYLRGIYHGRAVPQYAVEENRRKYALFGGRSPSNAIIDSIVRKVGEAAPPGIPVVLGNKHWRPWLHESLKYLISRGVSRITAVPIFPFLSYNVEQSYLEPLTEFMDSSGSGAEIDFTNGFSSRPGFIDMWVRLIKENWEKDEDTLVIFTAHSLPVHGLPEDNYVSALKTSSGEIASRCGISHYKWAFQSRGKYGDRWLEPSVESVVENARGDYGKVLTVPVGFCYDHLEVLYDLDIVAGGTIRENGMSYQRIPLPNDSMDFVNLVLEVAGIGKPTQEH